MRKFLLLLVLCLGSVGATFAQIKISGKVVDAETGQPLIGATVMIGTSFRSPPQQASIRC